MGKILVITGARQTGKTTLVQELLKEYTEKTKIFNCDNPTDRDFLHNRNLEFLKSVVGDSRIIFIDEAQKVENIGQTLKLLVDEYKKRTQIIATGSSAVHLLENTGEPLTGRKRVFNLFPFSIIELFPENDPLTIHKSLEQILIYGLYPEVWTHENFEAKKEVLRELVSGYLFKDIFEMALVKNPLFLTNLVKALAHQIGSEVSYNELSGLLGMDKKTVDRYIDLLEKNFILFRLPPYTSNKRREISRTKKIYFYDLGIRNAVINNFSQIPDRNDKGALFENFLMVERLKQSEYGRKFINRYFWRTYDGAEIDLIEEINGRIDAFEFKWSGDKRKFLTPPEAWRNAKNFNYSVVDKNNFYEWLKL
ncbi:MAG: ATP-binding protein [Bacteroidetes bacterium]|nr:ATP-binding protein [Bacteroidota bacterium]